MIIWGKKYGCMALNPVSELPRVINKDCKNVKLKDTGINIVIKTCSTEIEDIDPC